MNNFRNLLEEANEIGNPDLLAVPGAATIKAYSVVINSFLQHPVLPERISGRKSMTNELVNDIISIKKSISLNESIQSGQQESTIVDEVQPEIKAISKAIGMVHHLKHTHTK